MIPTLAAGEIRQALVDYLATTFDLADDDVRDTLSAFLIDPATGLFRGPYLRVRTPFRAVEPTWVSPLGWLPEWFVPYVHQAQAFERLTSLGGHAPRPTIVTTGTGSGKTECFLMPVLDHCARQRDIGQRGIKAIVLYPMNALASDQAGRLAGLITSERRLSGLRAGLYVGEQGSHRDMGPDHLIDDRYALRDDPPDILLTNYKMLDFLLLRAEDRPLWTTTGPDTLRYVVLDEFHTYDGAQGTDVAMLLRRLGATLGTVDHRGPLGAAAPVATSATLGSDPAALADLRDFAGKVFGVDFDVDSVIGETRQSVTEACDPIDATLPVPSAAEVAEADPTDHDALAAAFCRRRPDEPVLASPIELGERLLAHPVTRAVLDAVADRPRTLAEAAAAVASQVPGWVEDHDADSAVVQEALNRFIALVSIARRLVGGRERPLFSVEVQLWVREVTRLQRAVQTEPAFDWLDTPAAATPVHGDGEAPVMLPAVSCRRCGHSGWMSTVTEVAASLTAKPSTIYDAAVARAPSVRIMLRARPDDTDVVHLDPLALRLLDHPAEGTVPVRVTADEDAARRQTCPACGERNAVLFVGLAVASLASVTITTMFGSDNLPVDERKLLAFTDSVQDASHRAAFFAGRTHRFNTRSLIAGVLGDAGAEGLDLASLGDVLMDAAADSPERRFELVPPDLLHEPLLASVWSEAPDAGALDILRSRVGFEADLEFGLRSRVGRTLEQSVAAAAWVDLDDEAVDLTLDALRDVLGDVSDHVVAGLDAYLIGVGDRLRSHGAIHHPLLDAYVADGGRQWWIWGGRPTGLPAFTPDQSRPMFLSTATTTDFDSVTARSATPTWWTDWAVRALGLEPDTAVTVNDRVISVLAQGTDAVVGVDATGGHTVYGLDRRHVHAVDIAEVDRAPEPAVLRCDHCASPVTVAPRHLTRWVGIPCRRYRCPGRYHAEDPRDSGFYRRFYRQGRTRRVVTGEHTGLLSRRDREALETAFKDGGAPDAPNVLTATPTLEMGIDIGDLSTVMLTSVPRNPANYIQRVGRAGRATGNALVTTFVRSDTHGLYYLAEPEAMIAGVVRPPDCYLDAEETLRRQYVAYLMDRMADGTVDVAALPTRIGDLMKRGYDAGGLFLTLRDTSIGDPAHVQAFILLFGDRLGADAADRLRDFAGRSIESHLTDAVDRWYADLRELERRRDRLKDAVDRLEALPHRSADDEDLRRSLIGQHKAVTRLVHEHRDEYALSALERLGVLPNYTLTGDSVTLKATLWRRPDEPGGPYTSTVTEFDRPGIRAITEFAPGNTFYVAGHRHRITSLGIGTAQQPMYERWRICAECSYVELDPGSAGTPPPVACPRCGSRAIADTGAVHTVLRLRSAMAGSAEEDALVLDERDDRDRERYEMATLVDADPADVRGAWLLEDRTFGAEFLQRVKLRTLNLGIAGRSGERVPMGGLERHVPRFTVCRHCGAVRDVRDDSGGRRPDRLHEGWCKVRSGSQREAWDPIVLAHELVTEAIRLVVPVSMYEVDERLASFKGALLLGVREILGGNPDHLNVITSDAPNPSGQGRRRFLLIYDEVPGGTGYLGPLADAESVRSILHAARDVIARCPCRHEGRPACHRCLLGVVGRHEYDLVRRDLARDLLDELLEEPFQPSAVATVRDVDIGSVEESELERRFKVALREWADNSVDAEVILTKVPGHGRFESFDLTIGFGGDTVRYRIDEQKGLTRVGVTLPDLLITRMDTRGPQIAVYLDGYQFHASPDNNHIAADAHKRATVRAEGALVWNLTWDDVENFHRAVTADPPKAPPDRVLLGPAALNAARQVQHGRPGTIDVEALTQNPMALLLDVLVRPDRTAWQRAVLSAVAGLAAAGERVPIDADGLGRVLDAAAAGEWISAPAATTEPVALAFRTLTPEQLPIVAVFDLADPDREQWTVLSVLDDGPSAVRAPEHRGRWSDWLAWSNLLQFLGGPEDPRAGITSAASLHDSADWEDLWLRGTAGRREPTQSVVLSADQEEELELISVDATAVAELVRAVLERGAAPFVAGYELDGVPLEAAWPRRRVAVLVDGAVAPAGWDARVASAWTVEELVTALQDDSPEEAR